MEASQELIQEASRLFGPLMTMYGADERIASQERGLLRSDKPNITGFGFGPQSVGTWGFDLDEMLAVKERLQSLSLRICSHMVIPGAVFSLEYLGDLLGGSASMITAAMVVAGLWHIDNWTNLGSGPDIDPHPALGHTPFSYWGAEVEEEDEDTPEVDDPEPFDFDAVVARWMASR